MNVCDATIILFFFLSQIYTCQLKRILGCATITTKLNVIIVVRVNSPRAVQGLIWLCRHSASFDKLSAATNYKHIVVK